MKELPVENKSHPRMLQLRFERLVCLQKHEFAEILGECFAGPMTMICAPFPPARTCCSSMSTACISLIAIRRPFARSPC
jgi:hypothetical protein